MYYRKELFLTSSPIMEKQSEPWHIFIWNRYGVQSYSGRFFGRVDIMLCEIYLYLVTTESKWHTKLSVEQSNEYPCGCDTQNITATMRSHILIGMFMHIQSGSADQTPSNTFPQSNHWVCMISNEET